MTTFLIMVSYIIYTDGSCRPSKRKGGIGIVWLKNGSKVFEYSKGYDNTTNNRMELIAIGIALKSITKEIDSLEIVSDSEYAIGCISNPKWNPKKNVELINSIKEILKSTQKLVKSPIKFSHTYGHNGDEWNEYVDKLAQKESSYDL